MSARSSECAQQPSVGQRAARGALWQLLGGGWTTVVRLGASVFLARALTPEDFGVFGLALLVREFLNSVGALGMGSGVIAKKDVTQADLATCFWTMAGVRTCLFLLGYFGAPLAGYFLGDMRVVPVVRAVSFLFLTSILEVVSGTLLTKELQFGKLNVIRGAGVLFESGLAVILAVYTDLGYWALVYAMLASSIGSSIAIFLVAGWRPSLTFDRQSFRYLFRFGINGLGFTITNYISQNLDYLLVGGVLGARALGLYEFAYRIPHLVLDRISRPVGAIVFPAFAKLRDDDEKLADAYFKVVKYVSSVTFPLVLGLAAVAEPAVHILWGDQWGSIVLPLRILAIRAAFTSIPQPSGAIFLCKDRPELQFRLQAVALVWTALCVMVGGILGGVDGVAFGMLAAMLVPLWNVLLALQLIGAHPFQLFQELRAPAVSGIICAGTAYAVWSGGSAGGLPAGLVLVLAVAVGAVGYLLSFWYCDRQFVLSATRQFLSIA